jgi:protein-L-isoaspartate O-methyltransferase
MEEDDGQRELLSQILNAPGNEEFLQKITLLGDWSLAFLPRNQSFSAIIIHGGTGNIPPVLLGLLRAPGRLAGVIRTDSGFSLVITLTRNTDGEGLRGGAEVYFPAILGW